MADRPTETLGWATNQVNETVNIGNNNILVTNKVEPTAGIKNSGILARQPWPRPYLNWLFDNYYRWIENLDTRDNYVGIIKICASSAGRTITDFADEFGGTWVLRGTDTIAGVSVDVFERTA